MLRPTVVVSTYNNPRALRLVLAALAAQRLRRFEVIAADDGSGPETAAVIDDFHGRLEIRHLWQSDEGVRRSAICNRAILEASGDYLVFLDGDCIPPPQWLETHTAAAAEGRFVSGGKVLLSDRLTEAVLDGRVSPATLWRPTTWWREIRRSRRLAVSLAPPLARLFDANQSWNRSWSGEDSSTFAAHLHAIGGFDERFTVGWDDADVGARLQEAGIRPHSIRYRAPVLHLEHGRGYQSAPDLERNRELFFANRAAGMSRTPHGLDRHRDLAERSRVG